MAYALIFLPILMAALAAVIPSNRLRPWLIPVTGTAHLAMTLFTLTRLDLTATSGWLVLDPLGMLILLTVSSLFFFCSFYTLGYLRRSREHSNRVFCVCFMIFLGLMSLVTCSHHLGLTWVAVEGTTLATAPLIYFERTPKSIEATWKYMMVCSVGIALGLLGTFFLAYSSLHAGLASTLTLEGLLKHAPQLSKPWLHASFLMLLVGYGTKMGLAPMHTWLPDAHSEAPSPVSALLSGSLLPCAFLAILRIYHICVAAGETAFVSRPLLWMGLFSMSTACVFLVGQRDFKRMLAYSSVEHMGILATGLSIGVPALSGTLLHVLVHGLTKGMLFLSAGNIYHAYGSKNTDQVCGAMRRVPLSGTLFLVGFLAITGSPPFGPFISQFSILNGAFETGSFVTGTLYLVLLLGVFIGMGATVLKVVLGRPSFEAHNIPYRDTFITGAPIVCLLLLVVLLGLYIPTPITSLIQNAVCFLEGQP